MSQLIDERSSKQQYGLDPFENSVLKFNVDCKLYLRYSRFVMLTLLII